MTTETATTSSGGPVKPAEQIKPPEPEVIVRAAVPASFRGWREVSGWQQSDELTAEDELDDLLSTPTLIENYLPSYAYGDWYHNVAILLIAGLSSWIFGYFRFTLGPVFIITLACSIYYRTQIRKYRSVIKDNVLREISVKKIETDYETMDWFNALLDKYWIYLEPYICQTVADTANPIIASSITNLPNFVQAVWIDSVTLGSKPFRIESVKTLPETSGDVLVMDWNCTFTPNDHHDLTYKQLKSHQSQKAVVKIKVFGFSLPIVVKNVAFNASVRIRIHMTESFPHIDTINVSLPELPMVDFVTKILGETPFNWEVLSVPGLWPFIYEMISKYAGPLVLPPFSFQLNVEQLLSGDLLAASGILKIKVHKVENIKLFDRTAGNTIDPYITAGFNHDIAAKTTTFEETLKPVWNETLYLLVNNLFDPLRLTLYDYNDDREDSAAGILEFDLQEFKQNPVKNNIHANFLKNNKPIADVYFSLKYIPAILPKRLIDGSIEPLPDMNTGFVRFNINDAEFNIEEEKSPLSTSIEVRINGAIVGTTGLFKKNNKPNYNFTTRHIITNKAKTRISVFVLDAEGKELDSYHGSLNDVVDRTISDKPVVPLVKKTGTIKISGHWNVVKLDHVGGETAYNDPIGIVKVVVKSARDLRNLETVGMIDPYVRVLINGFYKGRTDKQDNTTDPDWDEAVFVPISSPNQKLTIEAMDTETRIDRSLGSFDIPLSEIITRNDHGELLEYNDKELRTNKLVARKFSKGSVTYSLSFYPVQQVLEIDEVKEIEANMKKEKAREEAEAKMTKEEKTAQQEKIEKEKELAKFDASVPASKAARDFSKTAKKNIPLNELAQFESGVFVYTFVGSNFKNTGCYLQAFFDASGFADYVSPKIKDINYQLVETGDYIVKDLDWSECVFRLVEDEKFNRAEDSISEFKVPTLNLLKNSFESPYELQFPDGSSFKIRSRFIPTVAESLPEENKISASGTIYVELKHANNLRSADSNGKSDPFVKFLFGKNEIYKSKTKHKNLNPVWNEDFQFDTADRYYKNLKITIYDWDFGSGQNDLLNIIEYPLKDINADGTPTEVELDGLDEKGRPDGSTISLVFRFKQGYIIPVSKVDRALDTAIFDTGKTFVGAGTKVIGGGLGAVSKVRHSIFGGSKD